MTSDSDQKIFLRTCPLLFALIFLCLWPGSTALAQEERANGLTVEITVYDASSKTPIQGARISISRGGTNSAGVSLNDVKNKLTDADGKCRLDDTDFNLTKSQNKLTVAANDFKTAELSLNDDIRQSLNKHLQTLVIPPIYLEKENLAPGNTSVNANADSNIHVNGNVTAVTGNKARSSTVEVPANTWLREIFLVFIGLVAGGMIVWALLKWLQGGDTRRRQVPGNNDNQSVNARLVALEGNVASKLVTTEQVEKIASLLNMTAVILKGLSPPQPSRGENTGAFEPLTGGGAVAGAGHRLDAPPPGGMTQSASRNASQGASSREKALRSYNSLSNGGSVDREPLYLVADVKSTPAGKMADDNVYLLEESNRQTTFVLFTDDDKTGWVFPNPVMPFREAALKEVFPRLTESGFGFKDSIEPVHVTRAGDWRWKVEPGQ